MLRGQEHTRFGRTFGEGSPMLRAYCDGGKLLMLGTLYDSSTFMHVVEVPHHCTPLLL